MSASRPHEMKSSTSQRAGSSRTFLKTMYFTSGAYVMTRRLRTWRLPVALYSRQSASASSADTRRLLVDGEGFMRDCAPKRYRLQRSGGRLLYRAGTRPAFITDLG